MGVTAAGLMLGGAAVNAIGGITKGFQENGIAQQNAQIYEAQAQNIAQAQKISAEQSRTQANVLRSEATTTAARNGLKISGSTANSISQSIMQIQMDNSYNQYNLAVEKYKAKMNADIERQKGRSAIVSGFMNAGTTALNAGANYYDKYWNNTNATAQNTLNTNGMKLSGGLPTTNKQKLKSTSGFRLA